MPPNRLVSIADLVAKKQQLTPEVQTQQRHDALEQQKLQKLDSIESTFIDGLRALIKFLDGKTTKTEVVNQLKTIGTPDVLAVVKAIEKLDKDVLSNKLDITPLQKGLSALEEQLKKIPKVLPDQKPLEVSNLAEVGKEFDRAIKNLKLEAPKVAVNVEKPNLVPIQTIFKDLLIAVKGIKLPEIKPTDISGVEKRLDSVVELSTTNQKTQSEANKLLKAIANRPMGGGGGSGPKGVFTDASGNLTYPQIAIANSLPVTDTQLAIQIDTASSTLTYIGKALPGIATSAASWQVKKIDSTSGTSITWASGNSNFDKVWDNRASLSYS